MRRKLLGLLSLLLMLGCGAASAPAAAATATTTFRVTANVNATCSISSGNLNFGTYDFVPQIRTVSILITCTRTAEWNVGLDAGQCPGATVSTRCMTGPGGEPLNYGLFSDAGVTVNWGNTVGVDTVSGTATGAPQVISVYGKIPGFQIPVPGGYTDTITATVTF